jgi:hypothetical protein
MAASSAAAIKDLKLLGDIPNSVSVESVKGKLSPNNPVSATAAAFETTLCPLVYSGNGGVWSNGTQFSSIY